MKKIRIGVIIDSGNIEGWTNEMLRLLFTSDFAEISLIINNSLSKTTFLDQPDSLHHSRKGQGSLFYKIYRKIDRIIFRYTPDIIGHHDIYELLPDVPTIKLTILSKNKPHGYNEDIIKEISGYDLDVLIKTGINYIDERFSKLAKYGIWEILSGVNKKNNSPAGFWEVMNRETLTSTSLIMKKPGEDKSIVIDHITFASDKFSPNRNANKLYWRMVSLIPDNLRKLQTLGEERFFKHAALQKNHSIPEIEHEIPGNSRVAALVIPLMVQYVYQKLKGLFFVEQWILLFSHEKNFPFSGKGFKRILPPFNKFWADPFIIKKDNRTHIFFEEFLNKQKKGVISTMELFADGTYSKPTVIIELDIHLSYPYTFEHKGEYYLIPESLRNNKIELYKCVQFPDKWEYQFCLMDNVIAADSTLFYHNNLWWLFVSSSEYIWTGREELHIYYTEDILNPDWKTHGNNPVIKSVYNARAAGKLFVKEGKIYRPAQDCSKRYGYAIRMMEILTLNENEYLEKEAYSIMPEELGNGVICTHTFNSEKDITIMDATINRFRFSIL